jgi:hypothetical protein
MMFSLLLAMFGADPQPPRDPFPSFAAINVLSYEMRDPGIGPAGRLTITAGGKIRYTYSSAPATNSGGIRVEKDWKIAAEEVRALFGGLAEDGLFARRDEPETNAAFPRIIVTSARWTTTISAPAIPKVSYERLRPSLVKAHPDLYEKLTFPAEKPRKETKDQDKAEDKILSLMKFTYTSGGGKTDPQIDLTIARTGKVSYVVKKWAGADGPGTPEQILSQKKWDIPKEEAEAVLRGLVADGLLALREKEQSGLMTGYPRFEFGITYGPWYSHASPREVPSNLLNRLRPYLEKGEPERWKNPSNAEEKPVAKPEKPAADQKKDQPKSDTNSPNPQVNAQKTQQNLAGWIGVFPSIWDYNAQHAFEKPVGDFDKRMFRQSAKYSRGVNDTTLHRATLARDPAFKTSHSAQTFSKAGAKLIQIGGKDAWTLGSDGSGEKGVVKIIVPLGEDKALIVERIVAGAGSMMKLASAFDLDKCAAALDNPPRTDFGRSLQAFKAIKKGMSGDEVFDWVGLPDRQQPEGELFVREGDSFIAEYKLPDQSRVLIGFPAIPATQPLLRQLAKDEKNRLTVVKHEKDGKTEYLAK